MRIIQLLPTLLFGDAVGNDTIALKGAIKNMGFDTEIYAETVDKRLPDGTAKKIGKLKKIKEDDVIIYHKAIGTDLTFKLADYKCRKIMVYHNITPPEFFRPYSFSSVKLTEYGYKGVDFLKDKIEYVLADSSYNKIELIKMGYKCPIDVRPILIKFDDYRQTPDADTIKKYSDGKTNIVFVGRIAPNKKQEDLIKAFCCYKKRDPNSRLILVGSYSGMENYYERLVKYAEALGVADDVVFTGHIKFSSILAFYKVADVFLCLSQHEGFCVPLAEAMFFDVPIVAYDMAAISDTLGGCGVLIDDNSPEYVSAVVDRVVHDEKLKEQIISGQRKRLEDFSYDRIRDIFEKQLKGFLGKK